MSVAYTTYLMLGIRLDDENEIPGGINDDRWIPYLDGHEDVEISIIRGMEDAIGRTPVFIGKRIASWDKHVGNDGFVEYVKTGDDQQMVDTWLFNKLRWTKGPAKLIFFTTAD